MNTKKVVLILLVGFLLFWLFQDPSGMADSTESLGGTLVNLIVDFFESVLDFVGALG